mmetsp:Transcript_24331/g.34035  ORF Transcript_24331/g.34035 Transcript_24331/m.34035 type:complete len:1069 (+) Transcript_24331:98-3304(+)|eukprot:CAMPEP_0184479798 /NCGR_PEP_ID=MMETSP0113_2-20130426/1375_1 /TAXON_ID=91329 /ORGANISM="Norrisiella sphaerica, Strain BC52" /LENGTH=1068 /DNA_ID=CAMNT_0026857949 /DNA_START=99 /DNA_END=3305 /DNA_ORIENTATION=+
MPSKVASKKVQSNMGPQKGKLPKVQVSMKQANKAEKVPYDEAPMSDSALWALYLAFIGFVSLSLMYTSETYQNFTKSGFSPSVLVEGIKNFEWKRGATNCSTLQFLVGVHIVYVICLFLVQNYAASRKTIPGWLPAMRQAHNCLLACLSAFMLGALIVGGFIDSRFDSLQSFICRRPVESQPGLTVWTMYIFYLSKMLEFLDTFFLILAKKKVIMLHKVHHLTTMSLVWHSLEVNINSEILSGGLNCFVHTLMYAYFAFPKGNAWLRQYMTSTQIIQFVLCLCAFLYAVKARVLDETPCYGTLVSELHGIAMYGVYLAMFVAFFISNYCKSKRVEKDEGEAATNLAKADAPGVSPKTDAKQASVQFSMAAKSFIWSCYFAVIAAAAAWLMQDSKTMHELSKDNMSLEGVVNAAVSDIENFQWVSGQTRGGSWQFLAGVHVVYAVILTTLMQVMKGIESRISWAKPLSKAHNIFMAAISAFMLSVLIYGGIRDGRFSSWDSFTCHRPGHSGLVQWGMYVFYLSKMLEFIDTFLLVMSKKKVILLHKVHHLTTMSLVWHSLETDLASEILCGGLNCFVHTLMYAYFAFPKGNAWLRKYMTSTQLLQFVLCLIGIGYGAYSRFFFAQPCAGTLAADVHGLVMYGVYLAMFAMFFYDQYLKGSKKKKAVKGEKKEELHEVILYGKRVNVTSFIRKHPGGTKVLHIFRNRDATEQFEAYHSNHAHNWLKGLPKRDLLEGDYLSSETPIAKDFKKMIEEFKALGFYKADLFEEIMKIFLVFGPYFFGHHLLWNSKPLQGCLLIGFGLYYAGWVSHDYLHHAVFRGGAKRDETTKGTVVMNNVVGYIIGFIQGYEPDWWRARHNTHHVVTNEHENDPDIKTAPVLTFVRNSPTIAKGLNFIQRWQQYYYLPVLCILDYYWRLESIAYIAMRMPRYWKQAGSMTAHIIWTAYAFYGNYQYLAIMSLFRGFLTGAVVFSTHYGEDILDKNHKLTLVEQTALTSRNIAGGYIANLLTGFLSLQTEHHLFPMMPTANLSKARPYVQKFFKKHGLEYRESNFIECIRYNIRALRFEHLLE